MPPDNQRAVASRTFRDKDPAREDSRHRAGSASSQQAVRSDFSAEHGPGLPKVRLQQADRLLQDLDEESDDESNEASAGSEDSVGEDTDDSEGEFR